MNNEENYITLIGEDGSEELFRILFTFDSEDYGKSYVLLVPAEESEEDEVLVQAYAYKEAEEGGMGELGEIDSDEEWDMIEEVLNTFLDEEAL